MLKLVVNVIASVLLLVGLASMITPIPGGTLLIALTLTTLICTSERAARVVALLRARVKYLNSGMAWLEDRMVPRFADVLRRTRPSPK